MNGNIWERAFVMIKPDGVKRSLAGTIIGRFEAAGLTLTAMKMMSVDDAHAAAHYEEHKGKGFFTPLVNSLQEGPVIAMCIEGAHAVDVVRKLVGATEPRVSAPGTIRGDYCHISYSRSDEQLGVITNLVHASDSAESAKRELSHWFEESDYVDHYKILASMYM